MSNHTPDKGYNEAAIHDRYVKHTLSRKETFKAFLRHFATEIYENIDLESLNLLNVSFVDENLRSYFSDLIYVAQIAQQQDELLLAMLIEHKSVPYEDISFQINDYVHNIWYQNRKQGKNIIPVVPIVIYHGKKPWQPKSIRKHFEGKVPSKLLRYIPDFDMIFVDFTRMSEEELFDLLDDVYLLVMVNLLKEIWRGPIEAFRILVRRIVVMGKNFSNLKNLLYEALLDGLRYLSHFRNFDYETAKEIIMEVKTLSPQTELEINEENPFGQLAKWMIEQLERAKEKGKNVGLLLSGYKLYKKGFEIDEIVELLEIEKQALLDFIKSQEQNEN